jgi:hypothetical protein
MSNGVAEDMRKPMGSVDNASPVPEQAVQRRDDSKDPRTPWELQRFVQQSSKFIDPPWPFKKPSTTRVLQPGESVGNLQFFPLDDVVMGGASASTFDNDSRKWKGEVTSRNSGGFVGIRSKFPSRAVSTASVGSLDLSATQGIELKLRPDGQQRRFKFNLRDNSDFNGIIWQASFNVGGPDASIADFEKVPEASYTGVSYGRPASNSGAHPEAPSRISGVETVRIPYSSFIPTVTARTIPTDIRLDLTSIFTMQLTLSKFEYDGGLNPLYKDGAFEMDVLDISTY